MRPLRRERARTLTESVRAAEKEVVVEAGAEVGGGKEAASGSHQRNTQEVEVKAKMIESTRVWSMAIRIWENICLI